MLTRCRECHASIPVPGDVHVLALRCTYCGLEQPVPDVDARRRYLLEQQREARLAEEHRAREAREQRQEQREEAERKTARRGRWVSWVVSGIGALVAPIIIGITVFDLPARLGFGDSGDDRLELIQRQLASTGCTTLRDVDSEYASSNVTKLFAIQPGQCARVHAAIGTGHSSLQLALYGPDGAELATAHGSSDPQLAYCATRAATLRFEIKIGPASKGRLSHLVMACPPPPEPAETPPQQAPRPKKPAKKR